MSSQVIINLDSRNRVSGTDEAFTIPINLDYTQKYSRVALLSCSIPKSFYTIPSGRNTFVLYEDGTSTTITLTPGFYSRSTLRTELQSKLNAATVIGNVYTVSVSAFTAPDTGKFVITSNLSGHTLKFIFYNNGFSNGGLAENLGFENTTYTFSGVTLTSVNVMNLSAESSVYLHSNVFEPTGNDDTLQVLFTNDVSYTGFLVYQNPNPVENSQIFNNIHNSIYYFGIYNEYGQSLSLNGLNMQIQLVFYHATNDIIQTGFKRVMQQLKFLNYITFKNSTKVVQENVSLPIDDINTDIPQNVKLE